MQILLRLFLGDSGELICKAGGLIGFVTFFHFGQITLNLFDL